MAPNNINGNFPSRRQPRHKANHHPICTNLNSNSSNISVTDEDFLSKDSRKYYELGNVYLQICSTIRYCNKCFDVNFEYGYVSSHIVCGDRSILMNSRSRHLVIETLITLNRGTGIAFRDSNWIIYLYKVLHVPSLAICDNVKTWKKDNKVFVRHFNIFAGLELFFSEDVPPNASTIKLLQ